MMNIPAFIIRVYIYFLSDQENKYFNFIVIKKYFINTKYDFC